MGRIRKQNDPRYVTTNTMNNELLILNFIKENGRPPTNKEVTELTGITAQHNISNLMGRTRDLFKEYELQVLSEIQHKLVSRIKARLDDVDDPMHDENLIKLMEYCFPKKVENRSMVETNVNVNAVGDLKDELENYSKLIPETNNPPPL